MSQQLDSQMRARGILLIVATMAITACSTAINPGPTASPAAGTSAAPATAAVATDRTLPTPPGTGIVDGGFVAPVEACAGGPTAWTGVPAIVARLADAWHEHDSVKRRAILDEVWAEDGEYHDPYGGDANGRDALNEIMGFGVAPGQYIELRSWDESDMQQGSIRMAWRHCCPSGISLLEGVDLLTLGSDGRIGRDISFWSRFVEEPAVGACDGPRVTGMPSNEPSGDPATSSCKGPNVDWSALPPAGQGYAKAWNERDPAARRALLETVWAGDGTFADQTYETPIVGLETLAHDIGKFQEAGFGAYFEPRPIAEGDVHHGHMRLPWTYCDAEGNVVWVGEDIAELDAVGLIQRVLSFFVF